MKRIMTVVAALGLVVTACGGGDDSGANTTPAPSADDATVDEATATQEPASAASEETEPEPEPEPETEESAASEQSEADDDDNAASNGDEIRSIDDVPEECRREMAEFLRQVEPIVSPIDWETATFSDFEAISAEFEARSDEFAANSTASGCGDLNFVDDNEFDLVIEFARDEAPGTVAFFEFMSAISGSFDSDGSGSDTAGGFTNCDEAMVFVQGLIDEYDSSADVPASQILQLANLSTIVMTCTPEQLEYFDSEAVNDFFAGE